MVSAESRSATSMRVDVQHDAASSVIHEPDSSYGRGNATSEKEGEIAYATGFPLAMIVVALALSVFLVALDMSIISTAIPSITDEFQGLDLVGWYGSAFFLTTAAFQAVWGKAYAYFPLKPTFLLAVGVFELGSLVCGVAPSSTALIIGRAIAGIGGAGVSSGAYTIIAFAVRPEMRAALTGVMGAAYGFASVAGPLLGGVFSDKLTWRWCFYINLPVGGLGVAVLLLFFHTPPHAIPIKGPLREKVKNMDFAGTILALCAVICYLLAMEYGGTSRAWHSPTVIGLLIGFALISCLFCVAEWYQGDRAMIVQSLLKNRTIAVGMAFVFFLAGCFFVLLYQIPLYFQVVSGVSPAQSGVNSLPLIIGVTIATIGSGIFISAFGYFVPNMLVGAALATVASGLIYTWTATTPSSQWIGFQALAGLGLGSVIQIPVISAQASVKSSEISSATSMILFSQIIGGALFVSAGQTALTNVLLLRLPVYAPGVDPSMIISAGATQIRSLFPAEALPGILQAYMEGIRAAFVIAIVCAAMATTVSLASKWRNLKKEQASGPAQEAT